MSDPPRRRSRIAEDKHFASRRRGYTGPVCAVCELPLHPLIADLVNTHPCCDPFDTQPKNERRPTPDGP